MWYIVWSTAPSHALAPRIVRRGVWSWLGVWNFACLMSLSAVSEPAAAITSLRAAADELGEDAAEALKEIYEGEESPELSGPYDEGKHRPGDVWFQVVHEPKGLKPGEFIKMPFRGRKFRTQEDAEEALHILLEQGTIKPDEKDRWGVEQATQGKGRTEVYRVRVS